MHAFGPKPPYSPNIGRDILFTVFDLCWPLTPMKVTVTLNLHQPLFWPSFVTTEHCLLLWPLWPLTSMKVIIIILNLHQQFFWPSLAATDHCLLYLTSFGLWTSMKVTIILNLHQRFFWPSLVAMYHSLLCLTSVDLWPPWRSSFLACISCSFDQIW